MSVEAALTGDEEHIGALEALRCHALQAHDIARMESLLHPEFEYVHASGRTEHRSDYLVAIADPRTSYGHFVHRDVHVTPLGTCALMGGVLSYSKTTAAHSRAVLFRFTAVWAAHDSQEWRLLRWHNTKIVPLSAHPVTPADPEQEV